MHRVGWGELTTRRCISSARRPASWPASQAAAQPSNARDSAAARMRATQRTSTLRWYPDVAAHTRQLASACGTADKQATGAHRVRNESHLGRVKESKSYPRGSSLYRTKANFLVGVPG